MCHSAVSQKIIFNAHIIADHVHVVVQAYRALQKIRIRVMNTGL
ncbi:transposase [Lactobacillus coleohominis]|uniref:Transposase n=1 Tax=Limosilactobacillus coleohominis TaxID=181675 RepID=A0ABS2GY38_9LACO|nr:transposase [Limosilactobacillus coleohominis]MBM6941205.1 transposase [Limosilactobacillus coleohominis]